MEEHYRQQSSGLIIYDIMPQYQGQGLSYEEYVDCIYGLPGPMPVEKPFTPFLDLYRKIFSN